MVFQSEIFNVILFITTVYSGTSWDKDCTKKFPGCEEDDAFHLNTACDSRNCNPKFSGCYELPPDKEFRQMVLDKHNELRNRVATGTETRGGVSKAADMRAINYDMGLEYTAICQVHRCFFDHDMCRGTAKFPLAGQNLGMIEYESSEAVKQAKLDELLSLKTYSGLIDQWYEEIKLADFKNAIDKYESHEGTGHFTAVIWGEVTHMGCARSIDRSKDKAVSVHFACNYAPHPNIFDAKIYTKGESCSKCPSGVPCNAQYKGLCGVISPVPAEENPYRADERANKSNNSYTFNSHAVILLTILLLVSY